MPACFLVNDNRQDHDFQFISDKYASSSGYCAIAWFVQRESTPRLGARFSWQHGKRCLTTAEESLDWILAALRFSKNSKRPFSKKAVLHKRNNCDSRGSNCILYPPRDREKCRVCWKTNKISYRSLQRGWNNGDYEGEKWRSVVQA